MDKGILKPGQIIRGPLFSEPMRVETVRANGLDTWAAGLVGVQSERFRNVTLTRRELETLAIQDTTATYEGDTRLLRLGLQAYSLQVVIEHERAKGRQVYDVHEKNLGYDLTSLDLNSGELRLIEVKGLGEATGRILLTPNERRVAEDRRDCYWLSLLQIATQCRSSRNPSETRRTSPGTRSRRSSITGWR